MADVPTPKPARGFHMRQSLAITLTLLSGRAVRFSLLAIAVLVVGWLLYANVLAPLQQPAGAPEGVPDINPAVAGNLLEEINNRQMQRSQFRARSYAPYNRFFVAQPSVAPPATPAPLPLPGP